MAKLKKPTGLIYTFKLDELGEVKYRGFKYKEQKTLLEAAAMSDEQVMLDTIGAIINACTFGKFNIDEQPMHIVDALFVQIYSKSVSNEIPLEYTCNNMVTDEEIQTGETELEENDKPTPKECGNKVKFSVNLNKVYLDYPDGYSKNKIIQVDDDQILKLKIPDVKTFKEMKMDTNWVDITDQFVYAGVECITEGDNVKVPEVDFTFDDFVEWLDLIDSKKIEEITEFYKNVPQIVYDVKIRCPKCGAVKDFKLEGLDSFFL